MKTKEIKKVLKKMDDNYFADRSEKMKADAEEHPENYYYKKIGWNKYLTKKESPDQYFTGEEVILDGENKAVVLRDSVIGMFTHNNKPFSIVDVQVIKTGVKLSFPSTRITKEKV